MITKTATAFVFQIFMAGDIGTAKQVCRDFCFEQGFCVTVSPTTYTYTGGEEEGFVVGAINYARFPNDEAGIEGKMMELGQLLLERCCQHSFTLFGPQSSVWVSRRPG